MNSYKPFIHLFKTPLGHYVYEVNRNTILKLSPPVYEYLENTQKNAKDCSVEPSPLVEETVRQLKQEGYLSSNRVEEIVHEADELLEYRLDNNLKKITLQITQQCNLRCRYCVYSGTSELQRDHTGKIMGFKTAKKGIDFLLAHSRNSPSVNISFYGGEPLLEFELIKKCIEYAETAAEGKDVTYNITTNGTILNEEHVSFFEKYHVMILVSLDGPAQVHDKNRRFAANGCGTFDVIMKNIKAISAKFPEYAGKIGISAVIDPQSDYKCTNEFFTTYELMKGRNILPSIVDDKFSSQKNIVSQDFITGYEYEKFKAYLHVLGKMEISRISQLAYNNYSNLAKFSESMRPMERLPKKGHPSGPCVPGELRLFMDAEGGFYPCERVSELSNVLRIGQVDSGFDIEKTREVLNVGKLTEGRCRNCWAFIHCSLCAGHADSIKGLSPVMKISHCANVKADVEAEMKDYTVMKELGHDF